MEAVDEFATSDEAASILGVPREQIDVLVAQGLLQPVEVDTELWFHRAEVEALRLQGA